MGDGWFAFGLYEEMVGVVGPIEFASDGPRDKKDPTEFGGKSGLIQDLPHELDGSEKRGVMVRAEAATVLDPVTGLVKVDESALAVDPVTGHAVDGQWNNDGEHVKPVDPIRTGAPTSGTL